ncbi:RHS repeat-associated core domain-containing protein [Streptomyces sp. SCUT-3]|uniref:RHS repeat-associated core domain-containing protein n=1 Tax=Streptomyces sp. SCUT-3 TaxID=2684469 RepID=UPI002174E45A|nr:RHS repeat-associated core domain-containing protein [Streptomyces sp. SCUT-3]
MEETRFAWDGSTLVEQTTHVHGSPQVLTLTWEHDGFTPLAQTESKTPADAHQDVVDQRFFAIVTDQIGTPSELVDEAGNIAWRTRATLWGTTGWNQDADAYTPLRFPGQYFDPETRLHHNYFRHYDPETGRYLTLDPLGLAPAPNPATYVDNPLSLTDPLGLTPCDENDVTWGGRVRYGAPGPGGRATSMHATIEPGMTGGSTNPSVNVPGYQKYKNLNKTHLLGAQIGGSNKDPRNFVTMHRFANSPVMRAIEDQIRKAVDAGETIEYSVIPIYASNRSNDVIPLGLTIEAHGNKGFQFVPYKSDGGGTNSVTVLNVPKRVP